MSEKLAHKSGNYDDDEPLRGGLFINNCIGRKQTKTKVIA